MVLHEWQHMLYMCLLGSCIATEHTHLHLFACFTTAMDGAFSFLAVHNSGNHGSVLSSTPEGATCDRHKGL